MRIKIRSSKSVFIGKGNHEPRTRVIISFKRVWGYSGKNKKKNLQWRNQKKFHDQFSSIKVYNSWKKSNVLYLSNKTDQGNLKKKQIT
jgi:hypothetical protein